MEGVYKHKKGKVRTISAREELGLSPYEKVTKDTLLDLILVGGLKKGMNVTLGDLIVEEGLWDDTMELALSPDPQVAFRASWALEWAYTTEPESIESRFVRFFQDFLAVSNYSVLRVYSKMLCDLIRRCALFLDEVGAEAVAEKSFSILTSDTAPVAVKVWQIELLYDLGPRFDWIEDNLTAVVRMMSESPECTPAVAAHARHYFRRLDRDKKHGRK